MCLYRETSQEASNILQINILCSNPRDYELNGLGQYFSVGIFKRSLSDCNMQEPHIIQFSVLLSMLHNFQSKWVFFEMQWGPKAVKHMRRGEGQPCSPLSEDREPPGLPLVL